MAEAPPLVAPDSAHRDRRYRQLFEQNTAVQLVVDPRTGAIVEANAAAADFYGRSRTALAACALTDLAALPAPEVLQVLEVAAAIGTHSYAFPHRHASGELRLVEVYAGPLHDGDRLLVHLIVHDVTERVRAEDASRQLHAERVAQQRTLALREALQRQETLSRMGELVAAVAHEVRNPLFAITSALDAMRARLGDRPEVQRYLPVLASQAERLTALMHDLLEFGRPATLTLAAQRAGDLAAAALDVARDEAAQAGVTLRGEAAAADALPPVRADRARVVQVLHNLLANAVQHSPRHGEVQLRVEPAALGSAAAVAFSVLDRGPGFSNADAARIFEPFYSRRPGGTGMGLALAQRLVLAHGGEISAADRDGGGAHLRVVLPAHD